MTHQEAAATLAAERYLLKEMSETDRDAFEAHYFDCEVCADDLRASTAMLQGAKEGYASPSRSTVVPIAGNRAFAARRSWYTSAALPWAVAATLAVVLGYQSLQVTSPQQTAPFALAPVLLRPESRGRETVVPLGAPNAPVTLALEINDSPQSAVIVYKLANADGSQAMSGRVAAPAPGTPLLLVMPAWTLTPSMHYILAVHDAADDGRLLGEYRFAAAPRKP